MSSEESKPTLDKLVVPEASPKPTARPAPGRRRRLIVLCILLAALLLLIGIPRLLHALNTVSTDDAYVNGYVTFVAPRVSGQVARVLVDDNYRVRKGDVLVELDPEPFQVQVAIKQAAVDTAQANLVLAQASVRGLGRPGAEPTFQTHPCDRRRRQSDRTHTGEDCHVGAKQGHSGAGPGGV